MSQERLQIDDVQMIGSEIAIRWADGGESFFELKKLRKACPCAVCAGEGDALGHIHKPEVTLTEKSFLLRKWEMVGGYAFQPIWADGHQTGLYSFRYLKELEAACNANDALTPEE